MNARTKLTEEQRKQLKPVLDQVGRGLDELSNKLAEMGVPPDEELFAACLATLPGGASCGCEAFVRPAHGDTWRCARPGCGHAFARHDVR